MWPMQMKPLQIYSMQMYPVKSAVSNIGNANTRCQRRQLSLGGTKAIMRVLNLTTDYKYIYKNKYKYK